MAIASHVIVSDGDTKLIKDVLFLAPGYQYAKTVVKNLSSELDRAKIPYNASKDPQNFYIHTDKVHVEIVYMDPVQYTLPLLLERDAIFGKKELVDKVYDTYRHTLFGRPKISLSKYIREAHTDPRLEDCPIRETYIPEITKVHFNPPMTIVLWDDGTKTMVKCQEGDTYSKETGLALCIAKKALGNLPNFNNVFKKWIPEESEARDSYTKTEMAMAELDTFENAARLFSKEAAAAANRLANDIVDTLKKHRDRSVRV